MANKKFSQFTAGAAYNPTNDGLARIAGFTTGTTVNNIWTPSEIATGLNLTNALQNIYNTDGTVGAAVGSDIRTITLGGTTQATANHLIVQPPNAANWGLKTGPFIVKGNGNDIAGLGVYSSSAQLSGYHIKFLTNATYANLGLELTDAGTINQQGKWQINGDVGIGASFVTGQKLTLKGQTSDDQKFALVCNDSSAAELFSLRNDGVAKYSGQAYTEQHDSLAGNATVDWNNGNVQYIQLASGANTFTPSSPQDGATYILQIKQPSSGAAGTITWGASVKWPAATGPILSTTNDYIDIVTLIYNGTTTHYYAAATLDLR